MNAPVCVWIHQQTKRLNLKKDWNHPAIGMKPEPSNIETFKAY